MGGGLSVRRGDRSDSIVRYDEMRGEEELPLCLLGTSIT